MKRKMTEEEKTALIRLSEAEETFLKCVDVIADSIDNKEAFYFTAIYSLCRFFILKLQKDEMCVLARVYFYLMKYKEEGNNERFN